MSPKSAKQRRQEAALSLIDIASRLWDDICSKPPPKKQSDLWTEHLLIRELLDNMRTLAELPNKKSAVDVETENEKRLKHLKAFDDWCRKNDIKCDSVMPAPMEDLGTGALGLRATSAIAENKTVITVPRRAMMTWDNAVESQTLTKAMRSDPLLNGMENVALAMLLLCERLGSGDSFWQPYLDVLPAAYTTPLFYTAAEMELLKPCASLFESALHMYRQICRQYVYFYLQLAPLSRSQALPAGHPMKGRAHNDRLLESTPLTLWSFTFDSYKWAVATVTTRVNMVPSAIAAPDENGQPQNVPALIPCLDLANHDDRHNMTAKATLNVLYDGETDTALCFANRAYSEGDQVFIHYGKRSDPEFLLHNGFLPAQVPQQFCALKLGLSKTDPNYEVRLAALTAQGLTENEDFVLVVDLADPDRPVISERLLRFVRVFVMRVEDGRCAQLIDAPENDLRAYKYVHDRLRLMSLMYGRALATSATMLTGNAPTVHRLLQRENDVLTKALLECDLRMSTLNEIVARANAPAEEKSPSPIDTAVLPPVTVQS